MKHQLIKSFKNDEDMFENKMNGQFWQWGRYVDWLTMRYPNSEIKRMHLVSILSGQEKVVAVGLRQINKYMKTYELEFGNKENSWEV